jgi:hypothetical protein
VAQVVASEVGDAGALEHRDPDATAPVLPAEVAALAAGEHERVAIGATETEVKLGEFASDGLEELGLATALRLRRGHLVPGDRPVDA